MSTLHVKEIRMICGLGNPEPQYAFTRHNIGFAVVNALAQAYNVRYWKDEAGAQVAEVASTHQPILLIKPQSYMNTSGGPLSKVARAHKIKPTEILVIHDEVDLPEGQNRVKFGGGLNAHNGLRSVADKLGTKDFARLRMGIGRPPGKMDVATYVLRDLKNTAREEFLFNAQVGAELCQQCISSGISTLL
ncbi:aminoacyl-tRNA hydrolase [Atopobium fossor]|uniref:aminoacyl-tRNA hydrolase n=1 Tax=Atopobium fossor TaxID=39487 RepID=UPI000418F6E3|nr:aminoacyl-tRNA hydrolase [Atopobium fossor]